MNSKSFIQNLALVFAALLFAAVLCEILLRMFLPAPIIWKYPQESYQPDSETGHRLVADQESYTHDKRVTTNSKGLRDREFDPQPGPGVHRIVAIGDSQTFGNGLVLEDTWPKQLATMLEDSAGAGNYEVLNAGLPASDTWQHELIMQRLIREYRPHTFVLAFYVNDIVERPEVVGFHERSDLDSPVYRLVYLLKRSALLLSLRTAWQNIQLAQSPDPGFVLANAILKDERLPETDRRWAQVRSSLAAMHELAAAGGVNFVVASLPRRDQVSGAMPAAAYIDRLRSINDTLSIPFIDLLPTLQAAYAEHGQALFVPWDGHNTAIANRVIAQEISAALGAAGI